MRNQLSLDNTLNYKDGKHVNCGSETPNFFYGAYFLVWGVGVGGS